ncbi:glycosyl hydrolase family protein [Lentzea sp. BCCO 10_0856]|uniref:Glycosyl hydrolase family protein n=1 Tax=Lentzea miocenica TaxID=3095431 RepID=A0ABU4TBC7_9PSEU|nr:glycosyl hydrolase family protein [Lentzea sp. BCCO 10_0856]MDX8035456.1 glycosyl hydrolase family protein [Lentzea sp. BCCO 10_0856]
MLRAAVVAALLIVAGASPAQAAPAVGVRVDPVGSGQVGRDFAGFSYEKDRVGARMFNARNADLVRLFRLLGPSLLRIGGNLVDMTTWNPAGAGGVASEVTPADIRELGIFAKATGWKVVYGINLKTNTPEKAAEEAEVAARTLGKDLVAFEVGNEPNVYVKTWPEYEALFTKFADAIRAKVPGARFDGPGEANKTAWAMDFGRTQKERGATILSTHQYIARNTEASIPGMLASNKSGRLPTASAAMRKAKEANGIAQWRVTEANNYYHGGAAGVSDVQAAALWSLDYMSGVAAQQGSGINFHGGTSVQFPLHYSPIKYDGLNPVGVQGVYYGELLWKLAGSGEYHAAAVTGAEEVTAWGIGNNAFVNNKNTASVTATITLPRKARHASVYVLTAPALDSTAITIAGSKVEKNAKFTPRPKNVKVTGTTTTVDVPANSAVLVVTR